MIKNRQISTRYDMLIVKIVDWVNFPVKKKGHGIIIQRQVCIWKYSLGIKPLGFSTDEM